MIARIVRPTSAVSPSIKVEFCNFDEFVAAYRAEVPGGGMFIGADAPLQLGERLSLSLVLSTGIRLIEGWGRVVECADLDGIWPSVIQFETLHQRSVELLSRLSQQKQEGGERDPSRSLPSSTAKGSE